MKKSLLALGAVIILGALYYLLSPLWREIVLDEASPLAFEEESFSSMDNATRAEFMKQVGEMQDIVVKMDEAMPEIPMLLARAPFIAREHQVEGEAVLIADGEKKILRFENFRTVNGPDLRIYLSADLQAKDFVEVSPLRATEGNVNYDIPPGTDTTKYDKVLVWCKAFNVLFSSAEF